MEGVQAFFAREEILELLRRLEALGLNFSAKGGQKSQKSQLSFSLTGTFPVPRSQIVAQMQAKGFSYDEQPLQTTQVMLIGEKAGSKAEKAKKI